MDTNPHYYPLFSAIDSMQMEAERGRSRRRSRQKNVTDTSIQALKEIEPTLPFRERAVLAALDHWTANHRGPYPTPTARELFAWMKNHDAWWSEIDDINSVRPRLTALEERSIVEKGEKRLCYVSGKRVYTWQRPSK